MAQALRSFDELSKVLTEIPDREVKTAIGLVRSQRAGVAVTTKLYHLKLHHLQTTIADLDQDALSWMDTVLCVRLQQQGRDSAWRRFAESAYRELLPTSR